jgi:protein-S-isoprenylcysteine O-methyltransferase Ste14
LVSLRDLFERPYHVRLKPTVRQMIKYSPDARRKPGFTEGTISKYYGQALQASYFGESDVLQTTMMVLIRAITYATLFIGFVLVFLPAQVLSGAGVTRPMAFGPLQLAGTIVAAVGATVAVWCILTFAFVGRGTPAPFDPPRQLVVRGPYRHVRNPMYLGAALAIAGAGLYYETAVLWAYAGAFLLLTHAFVVLYEEPTLRRTFGAGYEAYCRKVRRWWPRA